MNIKKYKKAIKIVVFIILSANINTVIAQERPKIVVGLMVDQMRWDNLIRFQNRYQANGFKRLLSQGFSCNNTLINYAPTVTACGHAAVYTGSVPAINGIAGNSWFSQTLNKQVYCTDDATEKTVGSNSTAGQMSPRNLLTSTIGDELRMATNFKSKVIAVALKDRASILPGGHTANAAFWYDGKTGNFISSTYYMNDLPEFAKQFNKNKEEEKFLEQDWNTLYPIQTYTQSTEDDKPYEGNFGSEQKPVFPHLLKDLKGKDHGAIRSTPFGNTLTLNFAKAAINSYNLGKADATDLIAISLSSPDVIGHKFGPNAIETEDNYLRLDKDLADLFEFLDTTYGKNNYLFFLTADHGVSHSPGYLNENKLPNGVFNDPSSNLNAIIKEKYGIDKAIIGIDNYQLYLDHTAIENKKIALSSVEETIINNFNKYAGVAGTYSTRFLGSATLPEPQKTMFINGQNNKRSGDILFILEQGWKVESGIGADHGLWNTDDAHIPLVFMGWGINSGKTSRTVHITDIAPTLAALLQIQMPNGCVGQVITEITNKK